MTTSGYEWLPDRQLGVAATLSHADELIGHVSDLLFAYQTRPDGIFELEEQLGVPNTRTVVTRVVPILKRVPLLVADALVALRAALEHALFAEVEFRDGALDEKAARVVEIPASRKAEDFAAWAKGRVKNGPPSLQPGGELVTRLQGGDAGHRVPDGCDIPRLRGRRSARRRTTDRRHRGSRSRRLGAHSRRARVGSHRLDRKASRGTQDTRVCTRGGVRRRMIE